MAFNLEEMGLGLIAMASRIVACSDQDPKQQMSTPGDAPGAATGDLREDDRGAQASAAWVLKGVHPNETDRTKVQWVKKPRCL